MQSQTTRWQLWVLGTVAVALVAVVVVRRARISAPVVRAAQGPGQHPHFVPRHGPKLPQVLMAGLWRTDGGYRATIHIQNALMVAPLSVTPTLYMADGTPLVLPAVEIPASGAASVDINQALATAPAGFAAHVSGYGSAALRYDYDSGGHVAAILMSKDAGRSLIHTTHFTPAPRPPASATPLTAVDKVQMRGFDRALGGGNKNAARRHLGLWWRHDAGVAASLTLLNAGEAEVTGRYRLNAEHGRDLDWHFVTLAPHAATVVPLDEDIAALSPDQRDEGGIEVEELAAVSEDGGPPTPAWGALGVGGWLENPAEGFSGDMDWVMAMGGMSRTQAAGSASRRKQPPPPAGPITLAAAGIMLGTPMAGDQFPDGVEFRPYGFVRNTTRRPLKVDLALSLAMPEGMGMAAHAKAAPSPGAVLPVELAPGETRAIDLDAWARRLQPAGGAMAGEMLNWSARYEGDSSDLLLTAGSVDESGSYVFQVVPRQLASNAGEQLPYWSTAEGDNTMYSLWNPGDTVQDVVLRLTGADGAGDYEIPLHLVPGGSAMVDLGMIRAEGMADMHGHLLPASASGSAMLEPAGKPMPGPDGVIVVPKGGLWSMQVVVSTGVFNPTTATCGDPCGSCCGYELPDVSADFFGGGGIGSTLYAQFEVWDCTGYPMNDSLNASWTASSGLLYVSVDSDDATFTALTVGQQWVSADDYISVVPDSDFVCIRFCEQGDLTNTGYADVVPVITSVSPAYGLVGTAKAVTISGVGLSGATLNFDGSGTAGMSATVNSTSYGSVGATFSSSPGTSSGNAKFYVTVNGERSQDAEFYVQIPYALSFIAEPCGTTASGPGLVVPVTPSGSVQNCHGDILQSNFCGVYRDVAYQLLDQASPPRAIADTYTITESFSNFWSSAPGDHLPNAATGAVNPSSGDYLGDTQWLGYAAPVGTSPSCLASGQYDTLSQGFSVTVLPLNYTLVTTVQLTRGFFGGVLKVTVNKSTP